MSDQLLFSADAEVELQGQTVLDLLALDEDQAIYQLIGFEDPLVTVVDYRRAGLRAMLQALDTGEDEVLAAHFDAPAHVSVWATGTGDIQIELRETRDPAPHNRLWIAIGIGEMVPAYDYIFRHFEPMDGDRYAFLSVYRQRHNGPGKWSPGPFDSRAFAG